MTKFIPNIVIIFILLVMSACTANIDQSHDSTVGLVEVQILIPEEISLDQESTLKVQIMQGEEYVEDADDVQFEIWRANSKERSELLNAQHEQEGIYSVKKAFQEDGIYYVQTHVTARNLHVMPTQRFIVGNVSEEELNSLQDELQKQGHDSHHGHGHHH